MGISDDIINQINKALDVGIDPRQLSLTAKKIAASVRKRTRLGKSVKSDGARLSKLEPLTSNYKKQRKGFKKRGELDSTTTPARSNLTKSGSMIDSIKSKTNRKGFEIFIEGKKNNEKASGLSKKRPFMNLASFEIKIIVEDIINRIRRFK